MTRLEQLVAGRPWLFVTLLCSVWLPGTSTQAQGPHLSITQRGGMPGWPVITDIHTVASNRVQIIWDGPSGNYQLRGRSEVSGGVWQPVGAPTAARMMELPATGTQSFFRVVGPAPHYAGSMACAECHVGVHASELLTDHTRAFTTLKNIGQHTNASCLPCHTVGFGLPTGFINESLTPRLTGVQCENCHGPGALHAANPFDTSVKPRSEIASTVCGGCHTGSHQPTYEEWNASGHRAVLEELQADFLDPARGESVFVPNCGGCHSGTVREALVKNEALPNGHEAGAVGIACVTCHDPHQLRVYTNVISGEVTTNQLRYPVASLADHHTSGSWATNYNPNINVCGQCHNDRAAAWTSTRAPHHSPQYNMLLGTVGLLETNAVQRGGRHGREVARQCVTCHMQTEHYVSDSDPAVTGHHFTVDSLNSCLECHPFPAEIMMLTQYSISSQIQYVKDLLEYWGANVAPAVLRTNYQQLSWEYNPPGDLSSGPTPTAAQQVLIPERIRKARFNLYVVTYDGSLGVHNGPYSVDLLEQAQRWVLDELTAAGVSTSMLTFGMD